MSTLESLSEYAYHAPPILMKGRDPDVESFPYRYTASVFHPFNADRNMFAAAVVTWAQRDLKAGRDVWPIYWLQPAGTGQSAAVGHSRPIKTGFCDPDAGRIYLRADLQGGKLVEVAAHEALHLAKHRKTYTLQSEREAIRYGWKVRDLWQVPDDPSISTVLVPFGGELPAKAFPGSVALKAGVLYRNIRYTTSPFWQPYMTLP